MTYLCRFLMALLVGVLAPSISGATYSLPGFSEAQVVTGLDPTTMAFAPDGSLFVCEKPGRLRLVTWNGSAYVLTTVIDLSTAVDASNECGLMSVAVDPLFGDGTNDHVYLFYTANTPTLHNRLSRFTVSGGTASPASELVLMDFETLPGSLHNGGGLRFGQDGKLYVATGDGSDAANSQNTGNLLGKLLRLNKDGSIPTDNPNFGDYTGDQRAIVALGLRNPYTLAVQSGTNRLFVNDVGAGQWEEVNSYTTGASPAAVNYGWSIVEGPLSEQTPPPNYVNPVHAYDHGVGIAICGSAFYHPSASTDVAFPDSYLGCYFFCDYGGYTNNSGKIYWINPTNPGARTVFASQVNRPIAIEVAPDGALWYVARGDILNAPGGSVLDNGSVGTGGSLYRVTYVGGGEPTKVTFVQQPSATNASNTIAPPVTVALRDVSDNIVNSTATVTLAIGTNPAAGTLSGTLSVAAIDGVATFSTLSIDASGDGYTLTASSTGLTGATSSTFNILSNVTAPVIDPGTDTFSGPVWVQLTSATPGATIHYTTNNTAPTVGSTLYSAPFQITTTTTVRAIALKTGLTTSGESSATMTISGSTPYGWPVRPPVSGVAMPATVAGALPASLSATNLFTSLSSLTAAPGFVPFDVNSPLWSDGADKRRWIGLPGSQRIGFAPTGEYAWPGGTIFIKHFELETNEVTDVRRRVETRVLVLDGAGSNGYGVTYRWNDAGSEAFLVDDAGLDESFTITTATGTRTQTWRYPSRSQCLQCHTQNAGFVLGPKTRQLNGTYAYPGGIGSDNQLRTWNYLHMFNTDIGEGSISTLTKLVRVDDGSATLEHRARSYLDANCANCHRPGGAPSPWDARFDTNLDAQGIIHGALTNNLGNADARVAVPKDTSRSAMHLRLTSTNSSVQMPPLARNVVDQAAMATIAQWIASMPNGSGLYGEYRTEVANPGFSTVPVLTRTDPTIAFVWGTASPGPGVNADNFTVRWTGSVVPATSGTYTFFVTSDDGTRLWVDNVLVIDQWVDRGPSESASSAVVLAAGTRHDLRLEYYENAGGAEVTLGWQSADQEKGVIPMYRAFPTAAADLGPVPGTPSAPGVSGNGTNTPTISGTGTPGSTIHILVDGIEVGSTTVGNDGTWSYQLTGLLPSDHQITVVASAPAGASGTSPATTVSVGGTGGGASSSSGSSSSCGLGGGLAVLGLFLVFWLGRSLRLRDPSL